jgi:hypothetical protein
LFFFHITLFAKIARTSTEGENFPGAAQKNAPFNVSDYCFYICLWITMYQYSATVAIQDFAHLFG